MESSVHGITAVEHPCISSPKFPKPQSCHRASTVVQAVTHGPQRGPGKAGNTDVGMHWWEARDGQGCTARSMEGFSEFMVPTFRPMYHWELQLKPCFES